MSSELELLRQRITELEAETVEVVELRKENVELRKENTDFRMKFANFEAERAELKRRIAETLRMTEEERTRRDAENAKLRAEIEELKKNNSKENAELRDRVTKVEQNQLQNDNSSNNNSSNFNSVAVPEAITVPTNSAKRLNGKLLEEKDMDSFLLEAHKKIVSSEIKQRNKEKKLQRESVNQDVISEPVYVAETDGDDDNSEEPSDRSILEKSEISGIRFRTEIRASVFFHHSWIRHSPPTLSPQLSTFQFPSLS